MKRLVTLCMIGAVFMMICGSLEAGKRGKNKGKAKPKVEKVTLEGKIVKKEVAKKKGKNVVFILETADGKSVKLPKPGKKSEIKLGDFVDKNVTVVANAVKKGDDVMVRRLISVTETQGGDAGGDGEAEEGGGEEPLDDMGGDME